MTTGKVEVKLTSGNIVELNFLGSGEDAGEHERMAIETREKYEEILRLNPDSKFYVLVDLTKAGIPPANARDLYIKTLSSKNIVKTAFFGVPSTIKSIVSFIVAAAGKGEEVEFFVSREDALAWLKN